SYWSISPLAHVGRRTTGGIPIAFDDDTAYLSVVERGFVRATMVVPAEVALCPSIAAARYATLFFLLRAGDLSLISIWSPTFLTEMLETLWVEWETLCEDIAVGRITALGDAESRVSKRRYRPLAE